MSRDEEASLNARAEEAKRRLCRGIERSKALVAEYRQRLLTLSAFRGEPGTGRVMRAPHRSTS